MQVCVGCGSVLRLMEMGLGGTGQGGEAGAEGGGLAGFLNVEGALELGADVREGRWVEQMVGVVWLGGWLGCGLTQGAGEWGFVMSFVLGWDC